MTKAEKMLTHILGVIAGVILAAIYMAIESGNHGIPLLEYWLSSERVSNFYVVLIVSSYSGLVASFMFNEHKTESSLKHILNLRDEAITTITHQIRTGLTEAHWGIETILNSYKKTFSDKDNEMLGSVVNSIKNTATLAANFLDVTKLDMGNLSLSIQQIGLKELEEQFKESVKKFAHSAEKKDVKLTSVIELDENTLLFADPVRLTMVLESLLENAVNYTPPHKEVHVVIHNDAVFLNLIITDTGIGIPATEQHKIFTKFYRARNARRKVTTGTGIGLYLAKQYIVAHQGTIRFESKENVGTTFFVNIPIKGNLRMKELFLKM